MLIRILLSAVLIFYFGSCITQYARLPSSVGQVYTNQNVQQSLLLLAQNNILVHIPEETTREFEKKEIDLKCRQNQKPLWAEKLVVYINELRKRPELFSRFHVIELKRGDKSDVVIQKDLDGATTLSIQFVKLETYEKVMPQTKIPCSGSVVEYLGRDLIKTEYEFPKLEKLVLSLQAQPEKKDIPRFQFSNDFLIYLAERGVVLKFSHDLSFEKTAQGKFVMAELLNRLAEESKQPFHQYLNYWFKQINSESTQGRLIQLFGLIEDKELKAGIRVDLKSENGQKSFGESDMTYLFLSYNVDNNQVNSVSLQHLDKCLEDFTHQMNGIKFRKPAATNDKESYLRPGYTCTISSTP